VEVDLGGVRTWHAVDGAGEPLVYLHGGFSDADELDPIRAQYAARFRVYSPDRRGHGRTADVEGPIDFVGQRVLRHRTRAKRVRRLSQDPLQPTTPSRSCNRSSAGPRIWSGSATAPPPRYTSRSVVRTWCAGWS
jgi:pimeloyl-ACP methyl ester carboxylesterase